MSLLDNQTYRKKIGFAKIDDDKKIVSFVINVSCNHDIDKSILNDIEDTINDMFLKDYVDINSVAEKKKLEKDIEKEKEKQEKARLKLEQEKIKEIQKSQLQNKKSELEYMKQLKNRPVYSTSGFR